MASMFYRSYFSFCSEGVFVVDFKHMRSVIIKFKSSTYIKNESLLFYYSVKLFELRTVMIISKCEIYIVKM
jgi:hypothetical protein